MLTNHRLLRMSLPVGNPVWAMLRDLLIRVKAISDEIDRLRAEILRFVTLKLEIFKKHPELLPRNRRSLQREWLQRGGYLYHVARRYVGISERLGMLRRREDSMLAARLHCINRERNIRRELTREWEWEEEMRQVQYEEDTKEWMMMEECRKKNTKLDGNGQEGGNSKKEEKL